MGSWGYGIFDNDDALDIKYRFRSCLRDGATVQEATRKSISDFPEAFEDIIVVLAIAALQMEQGQLLPEIRKQVLILIEDKSELHQWTSPEERKKELELFKQKVNRFVSK